MTEETSTVADLAAELRGKLVNELGEWEPFRTAAVEDAMRTVPRHVFLPGIPVEEAYSHANVVTHRDSEGVAVSSASSSGTVAGMLQQTDADAMRRALGGSPVRLWTGVMATRQETGTGFGDLDYWLAAPAGLLCRLLTRSHDHGLVAPALAYGSMALLEGETLAYLTKRPEGEASWYELGVCAYGPAGEKLASRAAERIRAWDTGRRLTTQIEVYPSGQPAPSPSTGTLLTAAKRHVRVIVRTLSPQE